MQKKHIKEEGDGRGGPLALLVFFLVLAVYFLYQAAFFNGLKRLF